MIIVAEIGQNFCGDLSLAKKMIRMAREGGADLAKFQLFDTDKIYAPDSPFKKQAKEAELTFKQAKELFDYGIHEAGIEVFFSVFDVERVSWCEKIGVQRYKVAYSQNHNQDIASAIWATGKPAIVSGEWDGLAFSQKQFSLLCVPHYPTLIKEIAFNDLPCYDGYSDHTIGLDAAKIALVHGARIIEKHFAVNHQVGVDAPWSMDLNELKELRRWADVISQLS